MRNMIKLFNRIRHQEEGQSLVEYGLIIALIALVVIGVLTFLGGDLSNLFKNISTTLQG